MCSLMTGGRWISVSSKLAGTNYVARPRPAVDLDTGGLANQRGGTGLLLLRGAYSHTGETLEPNCAK